LRRDACGSSPVAKVPEVARQPPVRVVRVAAVKLYALPNLPGVRAAWNRCRRLVESPAVRVRRVAPGGAHRLHFRGGCLTGPSHSGVELHGFLSYLVKQIVSGGQYTIFGYKGKQVRDQIHSHDVVRAFEEFIKAPRPGEVYNLGGGRGNSASMMECIRMVEDMTGKKLNSTYTDQNRIGDHICYISDLTKLKSHYPNWDITKDLPTICEEIIAAQDGKTAAA